MSDANEPSGRLADFVPYLLSITSNAVSGRIAEEYRSRFGLKVTEWRVMAVLGDAGPLTQRDLTSATLMDKVAVNRACKVLEERGLVSRAPNAHDGRSHHLELTEAGREMHDEVMPLVKEMEMQVFEPFTEQEIDAFCDLLRRIRERVGDIEVSDDDSDTTP